MRDPVRLPATLRAGLIRRGMQIDNQVR